MKGNTTNPAMNSGGPSSNGAPGAPGGASTGGFSAPGASPSNSGSPIPLSVSALGTSAGGSTAPSLPMASASQGSPSVLRKSLVSSATSQASGSAPGLPRQPLLRSDSMPLPRPSFGAPPPAAATTSAAPTTQQQQHERQSSRRRQYSQSLRQEDLLLHEQQRRKSITTYAEDPFVSQESAVVSSRRGSLKPSSSQQQQQQQQQQRPSSSSFAGGSLIRSAPVSSERADHDDAVPAHDELAVHSDGGGGASDKPALVRTTSYSRLVLDSMTESLPQPPRRLMSIWREFAEFAFQGSIMDLSAGIIIGGAFGRIVTSFVNDVVMPPIGWLLSGVDFQNLFILLKRGKKNRITKGRYKSLQVAKEDGAVTVNVGVFFNSVINFVALSVIIFAMVRTLAKFKRKDGPARYLCPSCFMKIDRRAVRCPYCTSDLRAVAIEEHLEANEVSDDGGGTPQVKPKKLMKKQLHRELGWNA